MKTKKPKRLCRITALILCVSMLVTSLPAMAFAESEEYAAEEHVTEISEELSTAEDLSSEAVPVSEIDGLRSETVKHFLNEDGSFTAVNYMTPVHYRRDGESGWTEIDNTLLEVQARTADGETKYVPQDSPVDVQITDTADSSVLVRLAGEEQQISWSYENLKKTRAEKRPEKEKKHNGVRRKSETRILKKCASICIEKENEICLAIIQNIQMNSENKLHYVS